MPNQVTTQASNTRRSGRAYKAECDRVLLPRRNSKPGYTFKANNSVSESEVYATLMALRG